MFHVISPIMLRFIYALILLLFFAKAQSDVITYIWRMLLGHPAQHWPWINGLWLSALFTAIASWLSRKLHPNGHPVAYVFTSFLVVSLVSFPFASVWWWVAAVLIALCIALLLVLWRKRLLRQWGSQRSLWQNFMPPTVFLLVLGLYMGGMAAAPDTVHYELRTAAALHAQHPHRAYKVGKKSLSTSPRLFALRCYLMATTGKHGLADSFFQQPLPCGGSKNLLFPTDYRQTLIFPPSELYAQLGASPRSGESHLAYLQRCAKSAAAQRNSEAYTPGVDYYLCALLMDKRIDLFAREMTAFYPQRIRSHQLPRYYAEALVYYTRTRTRPCVIYHDAAIEANLRDYAEMAAKYPDWRVRYNMMRRSYGETYWFWHEYEK